MKKLILTAGVALALTACRQNDSVVESGSNFGMQATSAEYITASGITPTVVSGDITSNTTWSGVIEMDGVVAVKDGATLTILPGTFIKAKPHDDKSATGVLVITKTGAINAVGTATQPIVFTSYNLLDGEESTTAKPGDFGGVVMLGDAPTNMPNTQVIEGLTGEDYQYGGGNAAHNGGKMQYVRIEFAGYELPTEIGSGNEINGLTLGGVGSGTLLDHIQVSYGADDGFEFFGGTVNASNLLVFAQDDDAFDFDHGYTGTITCALALADYNSSHSKSKTEPDSNGIELDGRNKGYIGTAVTHPKINNLTIVGVKEGTKGALYENGIHVRRAGKLTLNDAVTTGYPVGILAEGPSTAADLFFTNVKAHGFTYATATKVGATTTSATFSGVTSAIVSNPAQLFGMPQPFFNNGAVSIGSRNCNDFFGSWTKYNFKISE